ncbi:MAG: hypothetical protein C0503_05355 [Gemmatimonas sp.]|nr:hypothetical protein [Gemmatimonas sp.]
MNISPGRLVGAAVLTMLLARFVFIPIGERIAGVGDSLVWQLLPWLLIAAIWIVLLAAMRRARRDP